MEVFNRDTLNGYPVIHKESHPNGITTVMVYRHDHPHAYVVATWWKGLNDTWSWGHYSADLVEANKIYDEVRERNSKRGRV